MGQIKEESLNFYVIKEDQLSGSSQVRPLWTVFGDLGPFWYSHRMTVNSTLKWQIGFDVKTYDSEDGLIAIDDVIVEVDKPCPPKGFCDFEVGQFENLLDYLKLNVYLGDFAEERHVHVGERNPEQISGFTAISKDCLGGTSHQH